MQCAFPVRITIQERTINADLCGSGSETQSLEVSGSTAVLEGIIYQASYCVMKVHPLLDTNPPIAVLAEISAA